MGKYTKFFNKESEYNSFRNTSKYILPNVSYTDDTETVHFNPKVSIPKVALATLKYNATADNLLALNRANNISALRIDGVNIEIAPSSIGEKIYDIESSQITITDYDNFYIECPMSYFLTDVVSEIRFKAKDTNAVPAYVCLIAIDSGIMMATPIPMEYLEEMDITFDSDTNEFVVGEDIMGDLNLSIQEGFYGNFTLMDENAMFLDTEVYTKTTIGGLELPYYFTSEGEHVVEIETESGVFGGTNMFAGSTLYSVKFNEAITMVEDYTFADCTNLPVINNIRYADTYLVEAVDKTMSSYVMKSTTKWIGSNAFSGCTNWTDSLVIPNTVVSIGNNAFAFCTGLTDNLLIPYNVSYIGSYAFYYCTGLTGDLVLPRYITSINDFAFGGCHNLIGNLIIPSSVTSIGYNAFSGCYSLTGNLIIPSSVTSIGSYAFGSCTGLTSLELGSRLASIDYSAFYRCIGLKGNLVIPDSVTSIGSSAFEQCSGLTSLTLGRGLTTIGNYGFSSCTGLRTITSHAVTAPTIESRTFYNVASNGTLVYPAESDYSQWLSTDSYYLGYYNWNMDEVTIVCTFNVTGTTSPTKLCHNISKFMNITVDGVSIGTGNTGYTFSTTGEHTVEYKMKGVSIPTSAFTDCYCLSSVEIPDSIRIIGSYAFEDCSGLTSIDIPDSVTKIENGAFCYCNGFTGNIVIPDSVTSIGNDAFRYCPGLTSVSLGSGLTSIGESAFTSCYGFTGNLVIPDSVTEIGKYAFSGCTGLTSLSLGSGLTSISSWAFEDCYGLTSVSIPDSVTSIGQSAFRYCRGLVSVDIPDSVTEIENQAFYSCNKLTTVTLGSGLTYIGSDVFGSCMSLPVIDNMRYADTYLVGRVDKSSYTIKDGTKWIGNNVFANDTGLTSIVLPDSIVGICASAFTRCYGLTGELVIPDSVIYIGQAAFSYCTGLTTLQLNNNIEDIGAFAFGYCYGLTGGIVIPDSLTTLSWGAFAYCSGLTGEIVIPDSVTSIFINPFMGTNISGITVSAGNVAYNSRNNCNCVIATSTNELVFGCKNSVIPNGVRSITAGAFIDCYGLTSIVIPNSVTSIYDEAFIDCYGLISLTLGSGLTYIGQQAFQNCTGLTGELVIPNSVTKIIDNAFGNCYGFTSLSLGSGLTNISYNAFGNCTGITGDLVISNSLTTIGSNAFRGTNFNTIVVSAGNTKYDSRNNSNCIIETSSNKLISGCKNSVIPNTVTSIGNSAFGNCIGLTSIVIPDSVTSIAYNAFNDCYDLTSFTLGSGLTRDFNQGTFFGSTNLVNIVVSAGNVAYDSRNNSNCIIETSTNTLVAGCKNTVIPNTVTTIGYEAFRYCYGLTSIVIPDSVTSIGDSAFRNCTGLTEITCNAVTAPTIYYLTFEGVPYFGTLNYPEGSDYSQWLSTDSYYLGYYGWNRDELTIVTCTYDVTDTTSVIRIKNSNWGRAIYNNTIIDGTGYTFSTLGEHTVEFISNEDVITDNAFKNCYNLKSVDISNSVTEIGGSAFNNCTGLTSITCHAVNTPLLGSYSVFYNVKQNGTLYYPSGSNYSTWLSTSSYYLGYYNWTSQTI